MTQFLAALTSKQKRIYSLYGEHSKTPRPKGTNLSVPAKAASVILKTVKEAFASSPSAIRFPKSSFEQSAPAIFRGIRNADQIGLTNSGDLVLKPASNFGGKTFGISFTDDADVAWKYATRNPETIVPNPDGVVLRVRRDLFADEFNEAFIGRTNKPRLRFEGTEGEHAFYTDKPFVVPKGSWEVIQPKTNPVPKAQEVLEQKVKKFYNMDDRELVKKYGDLLADMELFEHTGGIDPFGFNLGESLAMSAKNSDAVNQVIFKITGGDELWPVTVALRAKINAHANPKKYIEQLRQYGNESQVTGLYGRNWFDGV